VHLGVKKTLIWCALWWLVATVLFALVNVPVALVNLVISGYLVLKVWKNPTPKVAHDLYKYSIAFPYVAGAVAGVQLVFAIFIGIY
jgi:hypothetical protein